MATTLSIKPKNKYKVIGLMSGTSLDGLDVVCCEYVYKGKRWNFHVLASETKTYNAQWIKKLSTAHHLPGEELQWLDTDYGLFVGRVCNEFIKKHKLKRIDFIASHGHTVFHQPKRKFTFQLGNGGAIQAVTKLPVVNDFRSIDVLKGGQGAPLVPIGDHLLFSRFDVCLNLGGIANLSRLDKGKRVAFDICFVNMGLNYLANKLGKKYDNGGAEASMGKIDERMLNRLNRLYSKWRRTKPSLGREGFEQYLQPILEDESIPLPDRLHTLVESISIEIAGCIPKRATKVKLLATGGGGHNTFLIEQLKLKLTNKVEVFVPEKVIVNYKEAIIFGFLGILRIRNEINVLKSVTGATSDSSAGMLIGF